MPKKPKYTINSVKLLFATENYTILDDNYINNCTPMSYMCPQGHRHKVALNDWNKGLRCTYCNGTNRHTIEEVKDIFNKLDYTLLEDTYINNIEKLKFICDNGHNYSISLRALLRGQRCARCKNIYKELSIEDVRNLVAEDGFRLISSEYRSSTTVLWCKCSNGHTFSTTISRWNSGRRCKKCYTEKCFGKGSVNWKGGVYAKKLPLFETYKNKLFNIEEVSPVEKNGLILLGVRCIYCNKVFVPTSNAVEQRRSCILGTRAGDSSFYCSDSCKQACPIYHKVLHIEGTYNINSREVQPALRKLVLERDNWTCQKCDKNKDVQLHCHHIDPVTNNPIESADIDNCITLCKTCHKEVHKIPGCGSGELRCKE